MLKYEGITESDWKVIRIALQKLQITGVEAPMMVTLLQKVEMELEFTQIPKESRPEVGDVIQKEDIKK
jgi:hypothetical protein